MRYTALKIQRWGLAAILVGLVGGSYLGLNWLPAPLLIGGLGLGAATFFVRAKRLGIGLLIVSFFLLSFGRGELAGDALAERYEALQQPPASVVGVRGLVREVLASRTGTSRFILADGERKFLIEGPSGAGVMVGDWVNVRGEPARVAEGGSFDYARYLSRQGISQMVRAREIEPAVPPAGRWDFINPLRRYLSESLKASLPALEGQLVSGMVLGSQGVTDQTLLEEMNRTGTRHIVAVSGFNTALVGAFFMVTAFAFGASRRGATVGGIMVLVLYVLITGLSPSAVRAGIMGGITLLALQHGQQHQALNALLLAAVVMLALNPLLFEDVSFQLSFTAVLGIIIFQAPFRRLLSKVLPNILSDFIALSLAVQLIVAPLGAFHFGSVAFLSVFFNLLVVPLVPVITILGLVLALFGPLLGVLKAVLVLPVAALAHFCLAIIQWGAALPGTLAIAPGSWLVLIGSYFALGTLGWWWLNYQRRQRQWRHKYA